ncbi:Uncharacterised protein [Klebsiella pneumoniae]|nr:Uncharacterised protein [Klebsiella pneumoniae]
MVRRFMVFLRRLGFLLSSRFCSGFVVFLRRLRFLLGCRFRGRFVMFLMVNGSMAGCCTRGGACRIGSESNESMKNLGAAIE